jgi:hypothetical protein
MEKITPTNPETDTANPIQVDHPDAHALLQAQAALAVKTSDLLTSYHDRIEEIRQDDKLEDGPYNDHLTDGQRQEILMTRKREAAHDLYQKTVEEYHKSFDSFAQKTEKHTTQLRESLFGVGEAASSALTQAISADSEQLQRMIKLSDLTGVETIGKAAFAAAVVRGDQPEVIHDYLQKNPDAEPLLRLYQQAPTEEWIKTQKQNISRLLQPPTEDQLQSRPQIRAF